MHHDQTQVEPTLVRNTCKDLLPVKGILTLEKSIIRIINYSTITLSTRALEKARKRGSVFATVKIISR